MMNKVKSFRDFIEETEKISLSFKDFEVRKKAKQDDHIKQSAVVAANQKAKNIAANSSEK